MFKHVVLDTYYISWGMALERLCTTKKWPWRSLKDSRLLVLEIESSNLVI